MLDPIDQQLLNRIQAAIPLVERPFAAIGSELDLTEAQTLERLTRLKNPPAVGTADSLSRGLIRQISAIFDSQALGYQSTLVAASLPESALDAAAAIINRHPGVSHNYRRNHPFNLWYTLAVPPTSTLGLEKTAAILHRQSGAHATRLLPKLKLYKIGVRFDMTPDAPAAIEKPKSSIENSTPPSPLIDADKQMIRILQQDLPLIPAPFTRWAQDAGISVETLLAAAQTFLDQGAMRRFSAVLHHRQAGIHANAMGVWSVPENQTDAFGTAAAAFPAVSHCYLRRSYPDWPYNLFTMVHAATPARCEAVLADISTATGIRDYAALYSSTEYKKIRLRYFMPDIETWEQTHGRSPSCP